MKYSLINIVVWIPLEFYNKSVTAGQRLDNNYRPIGYYNKMMIIYIIL